MTISIPLRRYVLSAFLVSLAAGITLAQDQTKPSLKLLRNYLRTVAKALPKKPAAVLAEGLKTYTSYAGQSFCEASRLFPPRKCREAWLQRNEVCTDPFPASFSPVLRCAGAR